MPMTTKRKLLAIPALLGTTCLALALAGGVRSEGFPGQEHEESPLAEAMEHLKAAQRKLDRALQARDGATALAAVVAMQGSVLEAKSEVPPPAHVLTGAEREELVAAYRKTHCDLLKLCCDLEIALLEGSWEAAGALLEDKIRPMEKAGHARFRPEEEDEDH